MHSARHPSPQADPADPIRSHAERKGSAATPSAALHPPNQVVQARLIQAISGSSQVQSALQFKAKVAQRMGPPVQRASAPAGGGQALPDGLKQGIEHLSGTSMDHVRVHYNSAQPAQLQAHAYAQGYHIHLAPGQSQHLPHEAWHVVQQQQGRVKPTLQLQGVAVNDQSGLEREADVMGARALQLKATGVARPPTHLDHADGKTLSPTTSSAQRVAAGMNHAEAPIQGHSPMKAAKPAAHPGIAEPQQANGLLQRKVKVHRRSNEQPNLVNKAALVADKVDELTQEARKTALNWKDCIHSNSKKIKKWGESAQTFFNNPQVVPPLIHARFGYAIEEIVNQNLDDEIEGLTVDQQVTAGSTRPDVVVSNGRKQIAWLDITAKNSKGHIFGKDGAGWRTRPFVAEILYKSLNLSEILEASSNGMFKALGGYHADKNQFQYEEEQKGINHLRDSLIDLRDTKIIGQGVRAQDQKEVITRDFMKEYGFNPKIKNKVQAVKGAIALAGLSIPQFGMESKGQKQKHAKSWIAGRAAGKVEKRLKSYRLEQAKDIFEELRPMMDGSLKKEIMQDLLFAINAGAVSEKLLLTALAARESLSLAEKAHEKAVEAIHSYHHDKPVTSGAHEVHDYILELDSAVSLSSLKEWHNEMLNRLTELDKAIELAEESENNLIDEEENNSLLDDHDSKVDEQEDEDLESSADEEMPLPQQKNKKRDRKVWHEDESDEEEKPYESPRNKKARKLPTKSKSQSPTPSFKPMYFDVQSLNFGTTSNTKPPTKPKTKTRRKVNKK